MIPVKPVVKPKAFDSKVKKPGNAWLKANPKAKRPKDYWSPFVGHLAEGFANLCGYAAMLDPTGGTVDHYLSCRNYPELAYEWSNYRFASQTLNASKRCEDGAILDPYAVESGWLEILLPLLQLRVTEAVPPELRAKAEYTIKRVKLQDGEKIIRWRRQWYSLYQRQLLSLDGLREVAPLIAEAVDRERIAGTAIARKSRRDA